MRTEPVRGGGGGERKGDVGVEGAVGVEGVLMAVESPDVELETLPSVLKVSWEGRVPLGGAGDAATGAGG